MLSRRLQLLRTAAASKVYERGLVRAGQSSNRVINGRTRCKSIAAFQSHVYQYKYMFTYTPKTILVAIANTEILPF